MRGQLNLFEPDFIKDADCTKDTPVIHGKAGGPVYGTGVRIKPRVPGRTDSEHMKKILLDELLPLEEYDLIAILLSGGKDSIACYYKDPQAEKEIREDYRRKINILRYGACKTLKENQMEEQKAQ